LKDPFSTDILEDLDDSLVLSELEFELGMIDVDVNVTDQDTLD